MTLVDVHTLVAFLGVFMAVVTRTLLPYVQKVREAAEKSENLPLWSQRYTATCLSALITGFVLSVLVFPTVPTSAQPASLIYAFVLAFGYGWGLNDAYNKVLIDWR